MHLEPCKSEYVTELLTVLVHNIPAPRASLWAAYGGPMGTNVCIHLIVARLVPIHFAVCWRSYCKQLDIQKTLWMIVPDIVCLCATTDRSESA